MAKVYCVTIVQQTVKEEGYQKAKSHEKNITTVPFSTSITVMELYNNFILSCIYRDIMIQSVLESQEITIKEQASEINEEHA